MIKNSKARRKNVAMAWIDNKKADEIVPQSWIVEYFKMFKISDKVINYIIEAMKNWEVLLRTGGKTLAEVNIQRGIIERKCAFTIDVCNSNDATPLYN